MIKVENIEVYGWEAAIRGMRNPLNSWHKSDSYYGLKNPNVSEIYPPYIVGKNDLDLKNRLYKAGTEHRKYLRMITVTMDITAPLYWWKEFDTYKVGTVANSCSTMHKIHAKEFELDDFSCEHLDSESKFILAHDCTDELDCYVTSKSLLGVICGILNQYRTRFIETKEKKYWWQMIQLLPSSYNQRRTVQMSYENVMAMIKQRENHKLDEWVEFVGILKDLPYVREITGKENEDE